jgi:hypothetical protein
VSDNAAMQHEVSFPKALKIVLMNFSFFSNKHDDAEQKKKKVSMSSMKAQFMYDDL